MITFKDFLGGVAVLLDGERVGAIQITPRNTFVYQPKGSSITGEEFETLAACKASLEAA